ncbi:hypothetical protein CDD83_8230 [Cordyceps sp. RAO-2017]|nr:hypothetical protein CDD83_8230 [Cordyceps sp. RAO-2017]
MRYSLILVALAALESVGLAADACEPDKVEGEASSNSWAEAEAGASVGEQNSPGTNVSTKARPVTTGAGGTLRLTGDAGVAGVNMKLSTKDVVQQVKQAGLSKKVAQEVVPVAGKAVEEVGGMVDTKQKLAIVMSKVAHKAVEAAGNLAADNNATHLEQFTAALLTVNGTITQVLGQSDEAEVTLGTCVSAAAAGESLNVIVDVTMATMKAFEAKKDKAKTAADGGSGDANKGYNGVVIRKAAEQQCTLEECRTGVKVYVDVLSQGKSHDVAGTIIVTLSAIGDFKSVDVTAKADFVESVVSNDGSPDTVTKIGKAMTKLHLGREDSNRLKEVAAAAANELKQFADSTRAPASEQENPASNTAQQN